MFNTPYDNWIRDQEYVIAMRYANRHAYANEMFNSSAKLRDAEARMPPIKYRQPVYRREERFSDIMGGITSKNMEGGLDRRFGEDNKMTFAPASFDRTFGYGRVNKVPAMSSVGKEMSESEDSESESDEEEETENRIIGRGSTALPQKYMKSVGESTIGPWIGTGMESAPTPSVVVSGSGAKKSSPWIAHVKKWCVDHQMSYRDALRDSQMKAAYHKVSPMKKAKGKSGGFLPLLPMAASLVAPTAVKLLSKGVKSIWNKIRGKGKSGGGVLVGPSNDPVNGEKMPIKGMGHPLANFRKKMKTAPKKVADVATSPEAVPVVKAAGKRSKKTGSSLFKIKGVVPLNVKDAAPASEEVVASDNQVVAPLPTEAQVATIGKGKGKKSRAKKVCMPVDELVDEHKSLVKVLEDKSSKHQSLMKAEASKQKKELAKYKKIESKKEDPIIKTARSAKAPSAWIKHVQAYAKQHGCSYKEAMSKAKASYKK